MMKYSLLSLLLPALLAEALFAPVHARADFVIVQSQQGDGMKKPSTITTKIKGDKIRIDAGEGSMILDLDTGDFVVLLPKDKKFIEIPGRSWKAGLNQAAAQGNASGPSSAPEIVDTGTHQKVGDYNAEIYTAEDPKRKIKFTFWISKEVPDYGFVQERMRKMAQLGKSMVETEPPDISKVDGIEVKSEIVMRTDAGASHTATLTLVSVKQAPVDDAEFVIPKDYKVTGLD